MVHDTDIVELELKSKRFSLSVKKKEALKQPEVQVSMHLRHVSSMQYADLTPASQQRRPLVLGQPGKSKDSPGWKVTAHLHMVFMLWTAQGWIPSLPLPCLLQTL
jgi:hypothetical protein